MPNKRGGYNSIGSIGGLENSWEIQYVGGVLTDGGKVENKKWLKVKVHG